MNSLPMSYSEFSNEELLGLLYLGATARSRNRGVKLLLHNLSTETDVPVAARSRSYGVHMTRAIAVAAIT